MQPTAVASAPPALCMPAGTHSSPTQTVPELQRTASLPQPSPPRIPDGTLRLRGGPVVRRTVTWSEEVIDNEELGRKKSKVCCIYHRAREFGESSDESSSDNSSSDDDSDNDDGRAQPSGGNKAWDGNHDHSLNGCRHSEGERKPRRPPSPNAYERMPRTQKKKESK
ncbi:phosphatase inhibitor-domain-containing protein [Kalaharituber pfeilii]|nr:phosphatase inhibitor-domain-containing protein [Kalaharituber pfeilii]